MRTRLAADAGQSRPWEPRAGTPELLALGYLALEVPAGIAINASAAAASIRERPGAMRAAPAAT